jgi:hypothetical protein
MLETHWVIPQAHAKGLPSAKFAPASSRLDSYSPADVKLSFKGLQVVQETDEFALLNRLGSQLS